MSHGEIRERLNRYEIPTDLPLVLQIPRFDGWKDPEGVIEAFKLARKEVECTLVLLGNIATDDPEGPEVYQSLLGSPEERILILSQQGTARTSAKRNGRPFLSSRSERDYPPRSRRLISPA